MAETRRSVIAAVAISREVDMSFVEAAFAGGFTFDSQQVEFDMYTEGETIALKGSFAKQANVVDKDDYLTVRVNPMQVNESRVDGVANVNKKRIGETVYGDATGLNAAQTRTLEDDIKGYRALQKRSQRLVKKSAYDVATTGKVTVSADGEVTDEVDYKLTNKIVNTGSDLWNDAGSDPVKQLEQEALKMKVPADTYTFSLDVWNVFMANNNVRTADNSSSGDIANFIPASPAEKTARSTRTYLYMGQTAGIHGRALDIYVEIDTYQVNATTTANYIDRKFAVGYTRGSEEYGQVQYGAIPVVENENSNNARISNFVGVEYLDSKVSKNPVGVERFYRSSPLVTMNQPAAFISIEAIS